jgi:hypothetical protein
VKYEIDLADDEVREFTNDLRNGLGGPRARRIADEVEGQIKIPVPTMIGAVVQTDSPLCAPDLSVFLRWASDEQTGHPWILREELDLKPFSTKEIGRITEVLSEGVDL